MLDIKKRSVHTPGMERKLDTHTPREPKFSDGDRRRNRAYNKRFIPAMAIYVVLLVAALQMDLDSLATKLLFVAVPIVPAALTVVAVVRKMNACDEYQRLAGFRAMSIGFGAAMVTAVIMGFVGIAFEGDEVARVGGWAVFIVGMLGWGVAGSATSRQ